MRKLLTILAVSASVALASSENAGVSFLDTPAQNQTKPKDERFGQIQWHGYQEMVAQINAQTVEKPVFLFVGQTTCQYCQSTLRDMQSDKGFIEFLSANYYPVLVYQDKEQIDYAFVSNFVPAFFVLDPKTGKSLTPQPVKGAVSVVDMQDYLERLKEAYDFYIETRKKAGETAAVDKSK